MRKVYFSIERKGAVSPEEVFAQLEEQTDFLRPDCCGGGISIEDVKSMMDAGYITLDGDKITVWS